MHKCEGCRYKGVHQEMGFCATPVCTKTMNLEHAAKAYAAKDCPYKIVKPADMLKQAVEDIRLLDRMGANICPVCAHYNHGAGDPKHCPNALKEDCFEWRGMKEG